ncbi:unnamed protein product, partial [Auanema sp. JU1783]
MSIIVRPYSIPFNRLFQGLLSDLEQFDRGFAPCFKTNMGVDIGNELKEVVNDTEKFAVSIDVSHFKPEELKVNLEGRVLSIEANQEKKDENNFFQRSFARRWTLPEDVDLTAISSSITPEGCLAI